MGGQKTGLRWRVTLLVLGTFVVGCSEGGTPLSAEGKKPGLPTTPEAAMALLPQADVVKRIRFRELWRLEESQLDWDESLIMPRTSEPFTPDGNLFLTVQRLERRVQFRSTKTGRPVRSFVLGQGLEQMWFTPDGTKLVVFLLNTRSGPRKGDLLLCDANTGARVLKFATPDNHYPNVLAFDPAGRGFVTGGIWGECLLFDMARKKPVLTVKAQQSMVRNVSFSSDGKVLAATADGPATYWNVADGGQIAEPTQPDGNTPPIPQIESTSLLTLIFHSRLPEKKGFLYEFKFWEFKIGKSDWTMRIHSTGVCTFDLSGRLTAWGVVPRHAAIHGVSPDGRRVLTYDTRDPKIARAIGEIGPPIRCWEVDLERR